MLNYEKEEFEPIISTLGLHYTKKIISMLYRINTI